MQDSQWEVVRLRNEIEASYQAAMLGMSGFAEGTAQHEFITKRMECMWNATEQLHKIAGKEAVLDILTNLRLPDES